MIQIDLTKMYNIVLQISLLILYKGESKIYTYKHIPTYIIVLYLLT